MEYIKYNDTKLNIIVNNIGLDAEETARILRMLNSEVNASCDLLNKHINAMLDSIKANKETRDAIRVELNRRNFIELNDGDILYIDFDIFTGELFAGGATNSGIIKQYAIKYDFDADIYANIEALLNAHDLY